MAIKKTSINVLDLPQVEGIAAGDYIVVETPDGTSIIDYENFIIGPENTTLTVAVSSLTDNLVNLTNNVATQFDNLSAEIYTNFKQLYIGTAEISIDSGHTATSYLIPRPPEELGELTFDDFIIIPSNEAACKYPCYITEVDSTIDGRGTFSVRAPFPKIAAAAVGQIESSLVTRNDVDYTSYFNQSNGLNFMGGTNTGYVSSFELSLFFQQLDSYIRNKYYVNADNIGNVSIQTDEIEVPAEELGSTPTYLIKVVKTYQVTTT
jgi:hypothetical protein